MCYAYNHHHNHRNRLRLPVFPPCEVCHVRQPLESPDFVLTSMAGALQHIEPQHPPDKEYCNNCPCGRHAGIQFVAGQEVTTALGHANAFGDIGWVDFRQPVTAWLDAVETDGGLLSVNHPLGGDCSWRHELPRRAPLAEVWHSD